MNKVPTDPQKVERIMHASMTLFAKRGFTHTKTEDVAQEAGVSKGLIFHYYRNKAGLFLDTYRYAFDVIMAQFTPDVLSGARDLGEMVVRGAEYKIQLQLKFPDEIGFLMEAIGDLPNLPASLQKTVNDEFNTDLINGLHIFDHVIDALPLREGVTADEVKELVSIVVEGISKRNAKVVIQDHGKRRIEDFCPEIERARKLFAILEQGFQPR